MSLTKRLEMILIGFSIGITYRVLGGYWNRAVCAVQCFSYYAPFTPFSIFLVNWHWANTGRVLLCCG